MAAGVCPLGDMVSLTGDVFASGKRVRVTDHAESVAFQPCVENFRRSIVPMILERCKSPKPSVHAYLRRTRIVRAKGELRAHC